MRMQTILRRVALRAAVVLPLVLGGALTHAESDFPLLAMAGTDEPETGSAIVQLLAQLDERNSGGVTRDAFKTVILAELDDQLKRPEIQAAIGASKGSLAVLYPELGEPYRSVFARIIEGIEDRIKMPIRSYAIGPNFDPADLNTRIVRQDARVVIALGRQGLKAAAGLNRDIPVVIGGVLAPPEADGRNLMGISLTPDPVLLFTRLKGLLPGVRRVIVIYDPQQNDWLIKLAREAAKAQGLELTALEARDLGTAARLYESSFSAADPRRDAVWLPQDSTTVDEGTIVPLVLKESWNRSVPIFSSSFLHVKKGALFALYPNNVELGRNLASSALGVLAGEARPRGVSPLRDVHIAVNLRTASHIGLVLGHQQQSKFDFVFPEP